jgi:hypothetical protein
MRREPHSESGQPNRLRDLSLGVTDLTRAGAFYAAAVGATARSSHPDSSSSSQPRQHD